MTTGTTCEGAGVLAMSIEALPAGHGDCLWVQCHGAAKPWRLLVDGGLGKSWPALRARIEQLPQQDRHFDLAVVTHIDADHIGGMLDLFADTELGVTFGDVWFNSRIHLPDSRGRTRSVAQGESLMAVLSGGGHGQPLPWNRAFGGGPVMSNADHSPRPVEWPDDQAADHGRPAITILGPPPNRLARLVDKWDKALDRVRGGKDSDDDLPRAAPEPLGDLEALAAIKTPSDRSVPNGSSIAMLIEHRGASCLLSGDAFVKDLHAALAAVAAERGLDRLPIDVFKLPHHGSRGNVSRRLVRAAPAEHYVVSTNGHRFGHPDDIAMARVITTSDAGPTLWFNYDTPDLRRWDEPDLKQANGYSARYPTAADVGIRIELEATT